MSPPSKGSNFGGSPECESCTTPCRNEGAQVREQIALTRVGTGPGWALSWLSAIAYASSRRREIAASSSRACLIVVR